MLVVDASVVINACLSADGLAGFPDEELVAPPLLWSEASSVLHEMQWRSAISTELAGMAARRLDDSVIQMRHPPALRSESWSVAGRLGWARTYDAEYVALALLLECRLMTIDEKLQRGAGQLVEIVGPTGR
jgi:predicted nucleic acid-binding protein